MSTPLPRGFKAHLPFFYPALMLGIFFLVPFGTMVVISFFQRQVGGFYNPVFDPSNYRNLFTPLFGRVLIFSLFLSALSSAVCVGIGFPFTYFITRLRRRAQVIWMVFLLAVLSLSEVIIGFAWSLLMSRTAGITNILVWLGLMETAVSLVPGFGALLMGMCYIALPYTVLVLYPPLSRLDPHLPEAARTLGASPLKTFFTVIIGALRNTLVAVFIMAFVFLLGAYLLPQILGRPRHWTLSVLITDQALYQSNMPMAAAMAIFFMAVSLCLVGLTIYLGKSRPGGKAS